MKGNQGWYRVNADTGSCSCPGFGYRRNCSHVDRLGIVLQIQKTLQEVVAPITTARLMAETTGQKQVPLVAGMTQDELRAVFR